MPRLIKGGALADDPYVLARDATALADLPRGVPVLVPLALWRAERVTLAARPGVGVWLAPADDPAALAGDTDVLPLVAVDFPAFADGRGYSTARLLRERHGFRGQLRAIGDVLRDPHGRRLALTAMFNNGAMFLYISSAPLFVVKLLGLGETDFWVLFPPHSKVRS